MRWQAVDEALELRSASAETRRRREGRDAGRAAVDVEACVALLASLKFAASAALPAEVEIDAFVASPASLEIAASAALRAEVEIVACVALPVSFELAS